MDLPYELVVHIFKFLEYSDRTRARLVCKQFYEASIEEEFIRDEIFFIKERIYKDPYMALPILKGSARIFRSIHFEDIYLTTDFNRIFEKFGTTIHHILMKKCNLSDQQFIDILLRCCNLKSLTLISCEDLLMGGILSAEYMKDLPLKNMRSLKFDTSRYLTDAILNQFVNMCPYIQSLSLRKCYINFHVGVFSFFYPEYQKHVLDRPTTSGLTFKCIIEILKLKSNSIKRLDLSFTYLNDFALKDLCEIPGLKLQSLDLRNCTELKFAQLQIASQQPYLTELNLSNCYSLSDNILHDICNHLVDLKILKIAYCSQITNSGLGSLNRLKRLEYLDISNCPNITIGVLANTLCSDVYPSMRTFIANLINVSENDAAVIAKSFKNLAELQLCGCSLTNETVKTILSLHTNLKKLNIANNLKLSYLCFADVNICNSETARILDKINAYIRDNINNRQSFDIDNNKTFVHLRNEYILSISLPNTHELKNLENLIYLDLSSCFAISDEVLYCCCKFKQLRVLLLANAKITNMGLICLALNCPAIEDLDLSYCRITDEAMYFITKYLKRIKTLNIRNCSTLTDATLKLILHYCSVLSELDVSCCYKMTKQMIYEVALMPSVCKVNGYVEDISKYFLAPEAPPLPII